MKRCIRIAQIILFVVIIGVGGLYVFVFVKANKTATLLLEYTQTFLVANRRLDVAVQENLLLLEQIFRSNTSEICLPDPTPVLSAAKEAEQKLQMVRNIATQGYQYEAILPLSDVNWMGDYLSAIKVADSLLEEIQQIKKEYKKDLGICFSRSLTGEPV